VEHVVPLKSGRILLKTDRTYSFQLSLQSVARSARPAARTNKSDVMKVAFEEISYSHAES
jgi:hypothetical protein